MSDRWRPGLNRFLSRDSYNGALADMNLATDAFTGNRYAFAGGNPITMVDHDGHRPVDETYGTSDPEYAAAFEADRTAPAPSTDGSVPSVLWHSDAAEVGKDVVGVGKGFGEAGWDSVSGLATGGWHCATSPKDCARGVKDAAVGIWNNPSGAGSAIWHGTVDPMVDDARAGNPGEALGAGIFTLFGAKGLGALGQISQVAKIGNTAKAGDELLDAAVAARNAKAAEVGAKKATVTGGYTKDGRVAAGCNRNPVGCAEDDVARQLGGNPADIYFTPALRPRTGEEVEICWSCQGTYSQSQFPPGTLYKRGGPWDGQ